MDFLTNSLNEVVSKLSSDQQEEIDVIESISNTTENNKETVCRKISNYIKKQSIENCYMFIFRCIDNAAMIRPKERESIMFLINSLVNEFDIELKKFERFSTLNEMLQMKKIVTKSEFCNEHIFDFEEEGTVGRSIFEDDISKLQQLMAIQREEEEYEISSFFPYIIEFERYEANLIELSAMFGSVNCFKYFLLNGDEITNDLCKFAIAGGENEIIHLCEQNGQKFEDCLLISALYHHYYVFEWLNTHFKYDNSSLILKCIEYYNEPLIYSLIFNGENISFNEESIIISVLSFGQLEVYKYLQEYVNKDAETKRNQMHSAINIVSFNGHLGIIKYLFEQYDLNIETKDSSGETPINSAVLNGNLEVVKYLYEHCHADVETKDNDGFSPINNASISDHYEIVKYLYETCHADIESRDNYGCTPLNNASCYGYLNIVTYLCEICHANINTKDKYNRNPIANAELNDKQDIVKYLKEQVQ